MICCRAWYRVATRISCVLTFAHVTMFHSAHCGSTWELLLSSLCSSAQSKALQDDRQRCARKCWNIHGSSFGVVGCFQIDLIVNQNNLLWYCVKTCKVRHQLILCRVLCFCLRYTEQWAICADLLWFGVPPFELPYLLANFTIANLNNVCD